MKTLTTAIQKALAELEKGDTLCEINAAHILRQALASAPIDADVQRDAERYRWLRKQHWIDRLDCFIDEGRAAQGGV